MNSAGRAEGCGCQAKGVFRRRWPLMHRIHREMPRPASININ